MNETTSAEALFNPGKATDFFSVEALPPFDPNLTVFHPANAIWLMECSRWVYSDDEATRRKILAEHSPLEERRFFNVNATQGALLQGPGFAVLVFRGTLGFKDFVADLDFAPVRWLGGGRVHRGFSEQLNVVWDQISEVLDEVSTPVFYTGHSLGAALAVLAGARRFAEGKTFPAAIYSFGSPRAGTTAFMKGLPAALVHHRVVNDRDLVPTLPPPRWGLPGLQYRHVGVPHVLDGSGALRLGATHSDEEAIDTALQIAIKNLKQARQKWQEIIHSRGASLTLPFIDHTPVNYTARLEKLMRRAASP